MTNPVTESSLIILKISCVNSPSFIKKKKDLRMLPNFCYDVEYHSRVDAELEGNV